MASRGDPRHANSRFLHSTDHTPWTRMIAVQCYGLKPDTNVPFREYHEIFKKSLLVDGSVFVNTIMIEGVLFGVELLE